MDGQLLTVIANSKAGCDALPNSLNGKHHLTPPLHSTINLPPLSLHREKVQQKKGEGQEPGNQSHVLCFLLYFLFLFFFFYSQKKIKINTKIEFKIARANDFKIESEYEKMGIK